MIKKEIVKERKVERRGGEKRDKRNWKKLDQKGVVVKKSDRAKKYDGLKSLKEGEEVKEKKED